MQKILIMGDSQAGINGWIKKAFLDLKYDVINIHVGGVSDLNLFRTVQRKLSEQSINQVEHIIWFQSDLGRNYRDFKNIFDTNVPFTIHDFYNEIGKLVYKKFEIIRKIAKGKTIVIGGSGSVLDNFQEYSFAHLIIKDWKYEILKLNLPPMNGLDAHINVELIDNNKNLIMTEKEKFEYMNFQKILTDAMKNSDIFYDNYHVNEQSYIDLSKRLDSFIKENI